MADIYKRKLEAVEEIKKVVKMAANQDRCLNIVKLSREISLNMMVPYKFVFEYINNELKDEVRILIHDGDIVPLGTQSEEQKREEMDKMLKAKVVDDEKEA